MKKYIIFIILVFVINSVLEAQIPPNAFNYSAVARNPAGNPIANSTIGIQITILKTSMTGLSQYSENHFVNTDAFGLFNLVIGGGAVQSGSMSNIKWGNDNYYLKVGMDAAGGTNFLTMGTTQLLSVPYALHSKTADSFSKPLNELDPIFNSSVAKSIKSSDTSKWNNKQDKLTAGTGISINNNTINLINGITITSISAAGDTLYLSNGRTFVTGSSSGSLLLPTITTSAVSGITSNSATFGGIINNANGNQIMERGIVYSTNPKPTIVSNKIIIGNGIGTFDTISALGYQYPHLLKPNTTYYVRAYAITENNITAYGNEISFTTLSVGQAGPGGGIVFFDKGNSTGGWQYLETATNNQSAGIEWGCSTSGTQSKVGSGEFNTALIIAGCNTTVNFAAKLCDNLSLGGQTDWFLPSIDELNLMYKNIHLNNQGNFTNVYYWSSSENVSIDVYTLNFTSGSVMSMPTFSGPGPTPTALPVRAIRAF
jgi:hypothetical protein